MRDWLAGLLLRWGLRVASDSHALWFWKVQNLYWESPTGRELRRRLGDGDE
jgi:hypothetical protein